jgi:hypothetical protein
LRTSVLLAGRLIGAEPWDRRGAGNAGKWAAIGAASGGAVGIIGNAGGAPFVQEALQQRYDVMYGQCMAANGNSVASFSPPPGTPPCSRSALAYSGGLPPYYASPPPPALGSACDVSGNVGDDQGFQQPC